MLIYSKDSLFREQVKSVSSTFAFPFAYDNTSFRCKGNKKRINRKTFSRLISIFLFFDTNYIPCLFISSAASQRY